MDTQAETAKAMPDRIRRARLRAGLSQQAIANRLGTSRVSVTNWEGGVSRPKVNRLADLAGILGVTVGWLLQGGDTPVASAEHNPPRKSLKITLFNPRIDIEIVGDTVSMSVDDFDKLMEALK